jgi:hypothetical protein
MPDETKRRGFADLGTSDEGSAGTSRDAQDESSE